MKQRDKTFAPRLPELAREKLKSGGGHRSKKSEYSRQREKSALRKLTKESFS